eukprot:COSAG02_NODE_38277_length_431_cov_0.554217_1_plen_68_part_10
MQLRRRLDAFPFDEWSPAAEAAAHTLQRGGHPTSSVQGCVAGAGEELLEERDAIQEQLDTWYLQRAGV